MKKRLLIVLLFCGTAFSQTNYLVEKLPSRIRVSGEAVSMKNEADIGFLGIGYELFGLLPKIPHWYFGANTYSALTGIRSGFFVFGVSTGIKKSLIKDKLGYDVGLFLGGGGGSGAPDGGGLMLRPHVDLEVNLSKKIAARFGLVGVDFPTGQITSLHANVGLSLAVDTYFAKEVKKQANQAKQTTENYLFNKVNFSMLSTTLFNYKKGPLKTNVPVDKNAPKISIIGFEMNRFLTRHLYGALELGGAFRGGVDGFMVYFSGLGYEIPFLHNYFVLDARALIGGAGGGDVQFGGGLATQFELGLGFHLKSYLLKVRYGKTHAPNGNFESDHLDISLGKTFKMYKKPSIKNAALVAEQSLEKENFNLTTFNRSYFLGLKKDKNGRAYDRFFNLICFEVEKKFTKAFSVVATTTWAYQGSYGAYAEGWLGLQYYYALNDSWFATAKGSLGAGGGGGINLGSGLAYQYALGLEKKINNRWSFTINAGRVRPVEGNFTPVSLDVGMKLNLTQLVQK